MERAELEAWLRLAETPGLGRASARALLGEAGSAEAAFDLPAASLRRIAGSIADALKAPPSSELAELIARTADWLGGSGADEARAVVALGDPRYPESLLNTADPPLLLHALGRLDLLGAPSLAMVGSRNPTAQGVDNARAFASALSQAGWTIVSGLALGIDGAAHEGALQGRGSTVAVVGTGLDRVYPRRHLALAHRIAREGAVVSEYPLGTPAIAHHFPRRNRLIAGLTRGTLVVEAAVQSGSLITARLAAESGREVFAIPGSIHSPQSRGCHALIKQGAKLVDGAQDIIDELGQAPGAVPPASKTSTVGAEARAPETSGRSSADAVLDAMGFDPVPLDELVRRCGMSAPELNARLLDLELRGRVARLPGQRFQRRASA
jgi:DNA processing protein